MEVPELLELFDVPELLDESELLDVPVLLDVLELSELFDAEEVSAVSEVVVCVDVDDASGVVAQSATLVAPAAMMLAALTATVTRAARRLPLSLTFTLAPPALSSALLSFSDYSMRSESRRITGEVYERIEHPNRSAA